MARSLAALGRSGVLAGAVAGGFARVVALGYGTSAFATDATCLGFLECPAEYPVSQCLLDVLDGANCDEDLNGLLKAFVECELESLHHPPEFNLTFAMKYCLDTPPAHDQPWPEYTERVIQVIQSVCSYDVNRKNLGYICQRYQASASAEYSEFVKYIARATEPSNIASDMNILDEWENALDELIEIVESLAVNANGVHPEVQKKLDSLSELTEEASNASKNIVQSISRWIGQTKETIQTIEAAQEALLLEKARKARKFIDDPWGFIFQGALRMVIEEARRFLKGLRQNILYLLDSSASKNLLKTIVCCLLSKAMGALSRRECWLGHFIRDTTIFYLSVTLSAYLLFPDALLAPDPISRTYFYIAKGLVFGLVVLLRSTRHIRIRKKVLAACLVLLVRNEEDVVLTTTFWIHLLLCIHQAMILIRVAWIQVRN